MKYWIVFFLVSFSSVACGMNLQEAQENVEIRHVVFNIARNICSYIVEEFLAPPEEKWVHRWRLHCIKDHPLYPDAMRLIARNQRLNVIVVKKMSEV